METLNLRPFNRRHEDPAIQIAPAHDCDGSLCHQPIFREDGSAECGPQSDREFRQADSIFSNYPPFPEEAARAAQ